MSVSPSWAEKKTTLMSLNWVCCAGGGGVIHSPMPDFPAPSQHSVPSPPGDPATDKTLICHLETVQNLCIIHGKNAGTFVLLAMHYVAGESRSCAPFCFAAVVCVTIFTWLPPCCGTANPLKLYSAVFLTSQVAIITISFFSVSCTGGLGEMALVA